MIVYAIVSSNPDREFLVFQRYRVFKDKERVIKIGIEIYATLKVCGIVVVIVEFSICSGSMENTPDVHINSAFHGYSNITPLFKRSVEGHSGSQTNSHLKFHASHGVYAVFKRTLIILIRITTAFDLVPDQTHVDVIHKGLLHMKIQGNFKIQVQNEVNIDQ